MTQPRPRDVGRGQHTLHPLWRVGDDEVADQAVVDQATGMLMAYYGVPATAVTTTLRRWAEDAGLALVHLAAGVVEAGSQPGQQPLESLRVLLHDRRLDDGAPEAVVLPFTS